MATIYKDMPLGFEDSLGQLGLEAYPEQSLMLNYCDRALEMANTKVSLVEAPTATGKTLVMAYHILAYLAEDIGRTERYVLAVPTIELAHQTIRAIESLQGVVPGADHIIASVVLGRQEFVSRSELTLLKESVPAEIAELIQDWLDQDGPGRSESYPNYLLDGLRHHMEQNGQLNIEFPPSATLTAAQKHDPAHDAYAAQFERHSQIYVVTHAMLARDLIQRFITLSKERRDAFGNLQSYSSYEERIEAQNAQRLELADGDEGRLPEFRRLIIDEAHLFYHNLENASRVGISLNSLIRHLEQLNGGKRSVAPRTVLSQIKKLRDKLVAAGKSDPNQGAQLVDWREDGQFPELVRDLQEQLAKITLSHASDEKADDVQIVRRAIYALKQGVENPNAVMTTVEWSPHYNFPTITVGRRWLQAELDFLWKSMDSAILISATLFTDRQDGANGRYILSKLHIPEKLYFAPAPIKADWLYKPVKVLLPQNADNWIPPEFGAPVDSWHAKVADLIISATKESVGTLVLSVSRQESQALALAVSAAIKNQRAIDGTLARLPVIKPLFIELARQGASPIWFAQGPAWTGLDLPDNAIDTLIIPRLPYRPPSRPGQNATKLYFAHDSLSDMLFTFKQGVGRLVRTRNATAKRLYVLDGRMMKNINANGALTILKPYEKVYF